MNNEIKEFRQGCYQRYLTDIQEKIPEFPDPYTYPFGNPIRPLLPVQVTTNNLMIIGAFPSARFETLENRLIPIADNLAPFEPEMYFDGCKTRIQESTDHLEKDYFPQLGISRSEMWITDIVKVYLYNKDHVKNCQELFPSKNFTNTHQLFKKVAEASKDWIKREIEVCQPKLIITLGEVCARVISGDTKSSNNDLLDGRIRRIELEISTYIVHLAHPEARRRIPEWEEKTASQLESLKMEIGKLL